MKTDTITKIEYEARDRWGYDTAKLDRELERLGEALNRSFPPDHELIRRLINEHLNTIDYLIGSLEDELQDAESDKQNAEDEIERLDYLLSDLKGDISRLINRINPHLCERFLDAAASARFNRQRFITITGDDAEAVAGILASVQALPTN